MNNDINYEYFEESEKGFSILKLICEFKFQLVEMDSIDIMIYSDFCRVLEVCFSLCMLLSYR